MATGTTYTIATRADRDYRESVTATDAGTPTLGSPVFIFDDDETQEDLIRALEKAKSFVLENVTNR
jgi:hypothetical protein